MDSDRKNEIKYFYVGVILKQLVYNYKKKKNMAIARNFDVT
jgi:hypothetical protein